MRKSLLLGAAVVSCFLSKAQDDNKLVIGKIDSISSTYLQEQRKVWVYLPNGFNDKSTQRYPVVYLMDGTAHFYSVVGMIQQFSQVNGNTICPEMIVVGIDNTDRTRDLTPTHIKEDILYLDSSLAKTSGGGENFISYLRKELIPYIDSHYPTQPFRMVIGHSFGGLMAMHMLIHHTDLFNVYVSIDPSMWWDNMKYLKQSEQLLQGKKFTNKTLFLGYANTMDEGMDTARVQKDNSPMSRHIRSIISVDHLLKSKKNNGLQYASKFYKDDSHTTVPLISTYDALRFVFRNYQFKLLTQDYVDSLVDLPGKFERHYKEASRFFGYPVFPAEKLIQGWGNEFLQARQYKKAFGFFELNTRYYPRSASAHVALADYYVQRGEKQKAIQSFQKALQINEDAVTRKKLEDLMR